MKSAAYNTALIQREAQLREALARIAELEAERTQLQHLAACAYQFAGCHDASLNWLDALSNAANGEPFDTEGLLPYAPKPEGK